MTTATMQPPLLEQLDTARANLRVSIGGALYGAMPSGSAFIIAHFALPYLWGRDDLLSQVQFWGLLPVLAACLIFSVQTIWDFCARFGRGKAACTIVALEGVMVLSPYTWHAAIALACLILVNAIATACTVIAERPQVQDEPPAVAPELPEGKAVRRIAARVRPA